VKRTALFRIRAAARRLRQRTRGAGYREDVAVAGAAFVSVASFAEVGPAQYVDGAALDVDDQYSVMPLPA
jgi:hypothetical protein